MLVDNGLGLVQPRVITYTGSGDTPGNREVWFNYEARPDREIKFYQGGVGTLVQTRLRSISTFVNNKPVKNYWLHYPEGERSQIDQIYECEGWSQTKCKAPTTFEYKTETGFTRGVADVSIQSAVQVDLDGNGIPDFFETVVNVDGVPAHPEYKAAEISGDITVGLVAGAFSAGTGFAIEVGYTAVKMVALGLLADSPNITYTRNIYMGTGNRQDLTNEVSNVQGLPCPPGTPLTFLDYDRDGKDDDLGVCLGGHG